MAIALDSAKATPTVISNDTVATFSHTCSGDNRILLVGIRSSTNKTFTVTYNSVSMTEVGTGEADWGKTLRLFCLVNPDSGAHNVVATANANDYFSVSAVSYNGAKQTGQPDSNNKNYATLKTTLTVSTAVVTSNSWLAGIFADYDGYTLSGGTGTTARSLDSGFMMADSDGTVASGSRSLIANTSSANDIGGIVISIAPYPPVVTNAGILMMFP
jgi:hypothetical protein